MRYPSSHSRIDPATYGLPLTQASTGDPSTYQDKIQKEAGPSGNPRNRCSRGCRASSAATRRRRGQGPKSPFVSLWPHKLLPSVSNVPPALSVPNLHSSLRSVASAEAPRFLPSRRRCLRETDPSRSAGRETKAALRSGENGER
ncbi:hypothetical protein R6Z07F_015907 [Ovis aries]